VPLARDRRTSEGCPGVALRATRGTAIISLTIPSYTVIKWNYSLYKILKLLYTTSRTMDVYNNIIKLAKWSYNLKGYLFLLFISYFPFSFLFVVRLKLFHFNLTAK